MADNLSIADKRGKMQTFWRRVGRVVFWGLMAVLAVCFVVSAVLIHETVRAYEYGDNYEGGSMASTLVAGDRVEVTTKPAPVRGDIVVLDIPAGTSIAAGVYVKRLIGLPGDRVACCDKAGDVTVNGKALHEQGYIYPNDKPSQSRFSVTLGPHQVWVMGDNRDISMDSREWGPVPEQDLVGWAFLISHGFSLRHTFAPPSTFAADGLAPPGDQLPLPLIYAGTGAVGLPAPAIAIPIWVVRRGRRRRRSQATPKIPAPQA